MAVPKRKVSPSGSAAARRAVERRGTRTRTREREREAKRSDDVATETKPARDATTTSAW
jgi:hypothetical protein